MTARVNRCSHELLGLLKGHTRLQFEQLNPLKSKHLVPSTYHFKVPELLDWDFPFQLRGPSVIDPLGQGMYQASSVRSNLSPLDGLLLAHRLENLGIVLIDTMPGAIFSTR